MIETRLLHYFLAIAREQNITRAAENLHITQSTLSKQMMDLEYQLGKQLFIRGKRKLTLTEEGEFLRNKAQEIIELIDNTESAFKSDEKGLKGDISIACGETAAMELVSHAFCEYHKEYPAVKIHLHSGDIDSVLSRLDKGLSDMGLVLSPIMQDKYDYIKLDYNDIFGLLMPADCDLAKEKYVTLEQMKRLPLIFSEQTFLGRHQIEWFGANYQTMNIVGTYNLLYNATFLVENGIGYAFCIDRLVDANSSRSLTFRPIYPKISVDIYIVTKKYQVFSPAVKVFLEYLKQMSK